MNRDEGEHADIKVGAMMRGAEGRASAVRRSVGARFRNEGEGEGERMFGT